MYCVAFLTSALCNNNRSAAYSQKADYAASLKDAQKALSVDPSYHKGYSRLGHAHFCLKDYEASVEAYTKAVEADPGNANLKASLLAAEEKAGVLVTGSRGGEEDASGMPSGMPDLSALGGLGGLGGMDFGAIMNNPGFMQMASQMMSNPAFSSMLQNPEMAQMYVVLRICRVEKDAHISQHMCTY